jgi:glycosyltransferase involved in cell wall biosynthesis
VGRFSAKEHEMFVGRLHSGYLLGVERGLEGKRKSRQIAPRPAAEFRRCPTFGRGDGVSVSASYPSTIPQGPSPASLVFTGDLARGFAEAGHEVHVVTRDPDGPYRMDFEEGVWVHRYPGGGRWIPAYDGRHPLQPNFEHLAAVYGAVRRIVERRRLDVVSGPLWNAEILFCAFDPRFVTTMTCMTPMRVVAEHHPAVAAQGHTAWKIKLEDAALRIVPHLQPVSHAHAEELARLPGVDPDKMQTIWHGVFDRGREFPRQRRDADAVEVLFIGRLEPRKGVDVLFNAAMDILRQRPNVHLRLVGPDTGASSGGVSYRKWLGERCREPEVLNRVIFEGEVTDERLYRAYAEADIFCAPSRYESFGLVAAEAMMMSLPVVATEVGGLTEIVEHGATGLLVPPDDVEALRAALFTLIDDGELRAEFGKAGRDRYEKEFRNEIAVERTAAWFERLSDGVASQPLLSNEVVQDRVVRAAAGVLERVAELEPESSVGVAARLLDPVAFPIDYVGAVRRLLSGSDLDFVAGLYRLFFDREPDPEGVRSYLEGLTGRLSRPELVREMALSEEARGRSVDPRFVDDPELLQLVFDADSTQTWLSQIAQSSHILFVQAIYRLVLGRPPDPNGASHYLDLLNRGTPRSEVVRALLHSEEARRRGLGVEIVDRLSRAAADLDGGLTIRVVRRVPIVRRLARLITKQRAGSKASSNVAALQLILEEQNRSILEGNRRGAEIVGELKKLSSSIGSLGVAEVARSIDEIRARVIELNNRVLVMQTKQEAIAIDVRERIAATPQPEELPEPVVLNPNVLEEN